MRKIIVNLHMRSFARLIPPIGNTVVYYRGREFPLHYRQIAESEEPYIEVVAPLVTRSTRQLEKVYPFNGYVEAFALEKFPHLLFRKVFKLRVSDLTLAVQIASLYRPGEIPVPKKIELPIYNSLEIKQRLETEQDEIPHLTDIYNWVESYDYLCQNYYFEKKYKVVFRV